MLGELEQVVLLAVMRVGKDAYGVPVHDEIQRRAGPRPHAGARFTKRSRASKTKGWLRPTSAHRRRSAAVVEHVATPSRYPESAPFKPRSKRSVTWPPASTSASNRYDARLHLAT